MPPAGQTATARRAGSARRSDAWRWRPRRRWPRWRRGTGTRTCGTHPLQATELGDRRFDDRLPDNTPAGRDRELAALAALRARVVAVPAAALPAGDRVTRSLLLGEIDSDLAFGSCALDDWTVDARDGTQVVFLRLPELQPVRTSPRAGSWWRAGKRWARSSTRRPRTCGAAWRRGRSRPPRRSDRVLGQLDDLLAKPDDKWPLRAPAAAPHADWPAPERLAFTRAIDAAIARRHPTGLRALPRGAARRDPAARARRGARGHPRTSPAARPATRSWSRFTRPWSSRPAEIHRIGLEELARIHAEMAAHREEGVRHGHAAGAAAQAARRSGGVLPRRAATSRRRRARRWRARRRRSRASSGGCRARPAWSSASTHSRRRTRRSPTTARPRSTARGRPPTTSTPTSPRRARATRSRRSPSTNRCPATTSRSRSRRS